MSTEPAKPAASDHVRVVPSDLYAAFRFYGRVTSDLIMIFDQTGSIRFTNEASERVLGCSPEECLGLSAFDFIHEEDRVEARQAFDRWLKARTETSFLVETRVVSLRGEMRHLHWTVAPYRSAEHPMVCFVSHARDVTSQVHSALRLQRSETRHRALLNGMLDPVVTIDALGVVREASLSVETVFGYRPEELIGENISMLMPEPHASLHDGYLKRYIATGATGILGRTRLFEVVCKDGSRIHCELSVSRVDVLGESEPLFVGSFRDVSGRLRVERALAESEARMRAIFDQEFEFVGLLDPHGIVLEINRTALESIGVKREDVVGRPFWETPWWLHHSSQGQVLRKAVDAAARGEFVRLEIEAASLEGRTRWVDFSLKPVVDADGRVHFLLPEGRDVTHLKTVHARELAMLDSLAAIGESASLLAHEIKNPLTAVNLALRAVADRLGEDQRSVLEDLATRLSKLERTMRRTLAFARPLELNRESSAVATLAEDVARLVRPEFEASGVTLELSCPADLPAILVDRGLMEEVLLNLLKNGREACERGGRVRLVATAEGRTRVEIRVEDDGPGVVPSLRDELFKPFVTSKAGGTGLGLAIARKVVREHGGEIGVEDSGLGGASFWIRLPAVPGTPVRVRTRTRAGA